MAASSALVSGPWASFLARNIGIPRKISEKSKKVIGKIEFRTAIHDLPRMPPRCGWHRIPHRSKEHAARTAGIDFEPHEFATEYELHFDPLPCWAHLEPEEYQSRVAEIVADIEQETEKRHQRNGTQPLGSRRICRQSPHQRPNKLDWSIAPLVHAATKKARFEFFNAYQWFVVEFRKASARLLAGDRFVKFPEGSCPPNLPWVPG
jgi:hypothetical protein